MLRRKAKRLALKPSKFRFITTIHSVDLYHSQEWERSPMIVQWLRHSRNVATEPSGRLQGTKTETHSEWEEPLGMVVTLYKDEKTNTYEEKIYTFTLFEAKGKKVSRPLASIEVNMAEYVSVQTSTNLISLHMLAINKKLDKVVLHITIRCEAAVLSDDSSEFDAMSDTSSVNFQNEDADALDSASTYSVEKPPEAVATAYDEQFAATVSEINEKAGKPSKTQKELEKMTTSDIESRSADQLRKLLTELKKTADKEKLDHEQMLTALLTDYANMKVRLAQSEYERERMRLEKNKVMKTLAQTKLKLIEQQQKLTKLEARLAKTG